MRKGSSFNHSLFCNIAEYTTCFHALSTTQQQVFFPLFAHHFIYFQSLLLCSSKNGLTAPFLNAWRGSLTAGRCKMGDVATRSTWTNLFKDVKRSIPSHKEFIFFFHSPGSSETLRMPAFIPNQSPVCSCAPSISDSSRCSRREPNRTLHVTAAIIAYYERIVCENKRYLYRVEKKILTEKFAIPLFTTRTRHGIMRLARAHSSAVRAVGS
jgi:hypothetical protein